MLKVTDKWNNVVSNVDSMDCKYNLKAGAVECTLRKNKFLKGVCRKINISSLHVYIIVDFC